MVDNLYVKGVSCVTGCHYNLIQEGLAMSFPQWNEKYAIGQYQIDFEHRNLFKLANRLETILTNSSSASAINDAIKKLTDYTKIHFRNEETFMGKIDYPQLQEHKNSHRKLITQITDIESQQHKLQEQVSRLKKLLNTWLKGHVIGKDIEIARYLAAEHASRV